MYINFIIVFFLILLFNLIIKKYIVFALDKKIISVPKTNDSHVNITPKGGGIVIFFVFIIYFLIEFLNSNEIIFLSLLFSIPIISIFSFIDDIYDIKWFYKILVDSITIIIISLFCYNYNYFLFNNFNLVYFFPIFFFISLWFINLINFTDGTDGYLCLVTTIIILINIICTYIVFNEFYIFKLLIFLISLNFLFYNKTPSKVFLGDTGSRLFATILIIIILNDLNNYSYFITIAWYLSLLLVLIDTGTTLIERIFKRSLLSRHQDHAYQILAKKYNHNLSLIWLLINYIIIIIPSIYLIYTNKYSSVLILIVVTLLMTFQILLIKKLR